MLTQFANHDESLTWTAHPARQRQSLALAGLGVIAMLAWSGALLAGSPWWGVPISIVLLVSLNQFFLPSAYSIDATGITAAYPFRTRKYQWSRVKRFGHDARGAFLSCRRKKSIMDRYVGLHVQFDDDPAHREVIVRRIEEAMSRSSRKASA